MDADLALSTAKIRAIEAPRHNGTSHGGLASVKRGWRRTFDDPIALPDGRKLLSLHDAATFITKLSKREHDAPEWQAAIEALMFVAESGARQCSLASGSCAR